MKLFSVFTRSSKETAKTHVRNLSEMAHIDGHFDSREKELLEIIARREKIRKEYLDKIVAEPGDPGQQIPDEDELKFSQFYDLVNMMLADEYIHDLEMQLIRNWGERFGYNKKHLNELIDSVVQNIQNGQDAASTRMRVQWMLR